MKDKNEINEEYENEYKWGFFDYFKYFLCLCTADFLIYIAENSLRLLTMRQETWWDYIILLNRRILYAIARIIYRIIYP